MISWAAFAILEVNITKLIRSNSAGQVGPKSAFLKDPSSPEHASAGTLGTALFNNESFDEWSSLFSINVSSLFFVSTAFLGLLAKASKEDQPFSANVVNITSISGSMKLAQAHVSWALGMP